MESSTEIVRHESESASQYLSRLRDRGFLFHGSNNRDIEELEPRYTFDPNSDENTDSAVFATTNIALTAIFGVYGGHKGWSTRDKDGVIIAKIPARDKELVENSRGVVYVLSKDTFHQSSSGADQYKSHVTVQPIEKVEVTVKDYYELGGKIEWF
jgi:hypothetical protein